MQIFKSLFGQKPTSSNDAEETDNQGLITTLEREFISPIIENFGDDLIHREEVYEIFSEGLGDCKPTYELLSNVSEADIMNITKYAQKIAEDDRITDKYVRDAIKNTLSHWSKDQD